MLFQIPRPEIPPYAWKRPIGLGWEAPYRAKNPENVDCGPWQGMPLGGLGAGCVGRSHRGDFNFWHFDSGEPIFRSLPACQFSIFEQPEGGQAQAYTLCTEPPADGSLSSWNWYPQGQGTYHALYPRSWFEYENVLQAEVICEQFSPVWAGCYQESSYPVAVFDWTIHNPSDRPLTVSILLTWQNTVGWFTNAVQAPEGGANSTSEYQSRWGDSTGNFNQWINDFHRVGCLLNRVRLHDETHEGEGQFAIASITNPALEAFYLGRWNPAGDGREVWDYFAMDGSLPDREDETPAAPGEQIAVAMAVRFTVRPGKTRKIPFILAWDFPVMEFAPKVSYYRRHSDYFGRSGNNAWTIVRTALKHSDVWKEEIEAWQSPTLKREDCPDWLKMALFNQLSLLATGGTLWTAATEDDPIGQFALLESLDSRCYESLDARLYGSLALMRLFPRLDKAVLEAFARAIPQAGIRKAAGATPRDLGAPNEHPWERTNSRDRAADFPQQDLCCAFVLQVYRDYCLTGATDTGFLWECWSAMSATLTYGKTLQPGRGLWIVALEGAIAMGKILIATPPMNPQLEPEDYPASIEAEVSSYQTWVEEARSLDRAAFPKDGWDRLDLKKGLDGIATNRLCIQFYANLLNLPGIVERKDADSALRKLCETSSLSDAAEIQTGTIFTLAALMTQMGMTEEALQWTETVVRQIYERGLQFRTPAAIASDKTFRASHHLEAMAIWGLFMES